MGRICDSCCNLYVKSHIAFLLKPDHFMGSEVETIMRASPATLLVLPNSYPRVSADYKVLKVVGHYPWFATYNFLSENIAEPPKHPLAVWLLRLAFIGFVASVISDSVSNSLRVVKTYRQVNDIKVSYGESWLRRSCRISLTPHSRGSTIGDS